MDKNSLLVSEIFGPTIQGEGASCGMRASFLRLGGCNLSCSWCDTPYTWDWTGKNGVAYDSKKELRWMKFNEIKDQLIKCSISPFSTLVVTGGEPMLQDRALELFIVTLDQLDYCPYRIEIETAGTIWRKFVDRRIRFNVSPKLENSGNRITKRYRPDVLGNFVGSQMATFKFVVQDIFDLAEVDKIVSRLSIHPSLVWIMPEGVSSGVLSDRLVDISENVIARGFNISPRLQIEIWGNRRGV